MSATHKLCAVQCCILGPTTLSLQMQELRIQTMGLEVHQSFNACASPCMTATVGKTAIWVGCLRVNALSCQNFVVVSCAKLHAIFKRALTVTSGMRIYAGSVVPMTATAVLFYYIYWHDCAHDVDLAPVLTSFLKAPTFIIFCSSTFHNSVACHGTVLMQVRCMHQATQRHWKHCITAHQRRTEYEFSYRPSMRLPTVITSAPSSCLEQMRFAKTFHIVAVSVMDIAHTCSLNPILAQGTCQLEPQWQCEVL